jgi:ABC-type maltose transport system permease subunit
MKQKDLALIAVMVFIGAILSLVVSNLIFSTPKSKQQKAEVVDVITSDFPVPPPKYFNGNAVNPAQPITIGNPQ